MTQHPLRRLAWLLDEAFPIPGTNQRVGFDALIGLVPGIGDAFGALLSTYIIWEAARRGASVWTVSRMLGNVAVETVFGMAPLLGDLFDVVWKANTKNIALLGDTLERSPVERDAQRTIRLASLLIVGVMTALLALALLGTVALFRVLFG